MSKPPDNLSNLDGHDPSRRQPLAMNPYHDFIYAVERNVSSAGFHVSRDVALADRTTASLVASRTTISWKRLGIISQHILLRHAPTATVEDFHALIDCGFVHANRTNRVPLLRGLFFCYLIVPCIAVDSATPDLIRFVTSRPRGHWAWSEFPVLHDLATGKTHYFEESEPWGAFFASGLRSITPPRVTV